MTSSLLFAKQNSVMLPRLLIINGLGAFALNVFSFNANKATSPLAMNIGGIVKQIFSIVLALVIFATPVTGMTIAGIMVSARVHIDACVPVCLRP